ncbi:MAG: type I-C CRISPR-associated protein Cas8c/Csd1, partial [Ruthenibacterium sp.]
QALLTLGVRHQTIQTDSVTYRTVNNGVQTSAGGVRSTYDKSEGREPNAIRMQAVFTQRPLYAWGIISRQLLPYFAQMQPGLRAYFKNIIGEITEMMPPTDDPMLGKKLDDTYLFGYYHQRSALTRKKETLTTKEHENEYSEQ